MSSISFMPAIIPTLALMISTIKPGLSLYDHYALSQLTNPNPKVNGQQVLSTLVKDDYQYRMNQLKANPVFQLLPKWFTAPVIENYTPNGQYLQNLLNWKSLPNTGGQINTSMFWMNPFSGSFTRDSVWDSVWTYNYPGTQNIYKTTTPILEEEEEEVGAGPAAARKAEQSPFEGESWVA